MASYNLLDLPQHLLTDILARFYQPSPRHVSALKLPPPSQQPLPPILLFVAQSHPTLASAVADLISPVSTYLTTRSTRSVCHFTDSGYSKQYLPEWLRVLSRYVQGVSTFESLRFPGSFDDDRNHYFCESGQILRAIGTEPLLLRVLDIRTMPIHLVSSGEELLERALRNVGKGLKTLGVPALVEVGRALQEVQMPNLETLWVYLLHAVYFSPTGYENRFDSHKLAFESILGGVRGSRVNDLVLERVTEMPNIGMFHTFATGLSKLTVQSLFKRRREKLESVANVVGSLNSLKKFTWNGMLNETFVQRILKGGLRGGEVELQQCKKSRKWWGEDSLVKSCEMMGGRLRGLTVADDLNEDMMKEIVEKCYNLETFGMVVRPENVGCLNWLGGLKVLDLGFLSADEGPMLGQSWSELADGVEKMRELEIFKIMLKSKYYESVNRETEWNEVRAGTERILKSMGEKAKVVNVYVPVQVGGYVELFEGYSDVLITSMVCTGLRELMLNFRWECPYADPQDSELIWEGGFDPVEVCELFLVLKEKVYNNLKGLCLMDLKPLDREAEEIIDRLMAELD